MNAPRHATFADVRAVASTLADVEPAMMYGAPGFRLRGRFLACIATNKAAEPDTLVVAVGFEARDTLVASEPDVYYLKDHYVNYPCVLVRLSRVHPDALRDLVHGAYRFVSATVRKESTRTSARSRRTVPRSRSIR